MSDSKNSINSEEILPQSERLQALSPEEYELLWGQPVFSDSDRDLFFQLNSREQQFLGQLRTPRTKANFLLQLGYFRARQRFFPLDLSLVADDLDHLSDRYLDGTAISTLNISKQAIRHYRTSFAVLWRLNGSDWAMFSSGPSRQRRSY